MREMVQYFRNPIKYTQGLLAEVGLELEMRLGFAKSFKKGDFPIERHPLISKLTTDVLADTVRGEDIFRRIGGPVVRWLKFSH